MIDKSVWLFYVLAEGVWMLFWNKYVIIIMFIKNCKTYVLVVGVGAEKLNKMKNY